METLYEGNLWPTGTMGTTPRRTALARVVLPHPRSPSAAEEKGGERHETGTGDAGSGGVKVGR
jgi:hypothetical protein